MLRCSAARRGAGLVRGLGLVVVGVFLVAQVVIASFDLTVLGRVLDYLLTTVTLGLLVIFQPELRRGLLVLGRYRVLRLRPGQEYPIADKLADAAEAMSRECVGALIALSASMTLARSSRPASGSTRRCRPTCCAPSSASAARCTTGR